MPNTSAVMDSELIREIVCGTALFMVVPPRAVSIGRVRIDGRAVNTRRHGGKGSPVLWITCGEGGAGPEVYPPAGCPRRERRRTSECPPFCIGREGT